MKQELTITLLPEEERDEAALRAALNQAIKAAGLSLSASDARLIKRSVDARHGRVLIHLRYAFGMESAGAALNPARWRDADPAKRVIIVGSGPAGLFAALKLLEHGVTPIVLERGESASDRKKSIALISRTGAVNPDSNYCFGEGGAGTFSDGKLYTRSKKRGDEEGVRAVFHAHGADESILTEAQPHIGTDKLPAIVRAMRERIESHGGEIRFSLRCDGFIVGEGRVRGVTAVPVTGATEDGGSLPAKRIEILADSVILATGHSARDIHETLAALETRLSDGGKKPVRILEAKTFAMGVRLEHPRARIDAIQYHGREKTEDLPAATYRLVAQAGGRGVYSFCMCPGGLVVPSASEDGAVVVNGMSPSSRASRWSNAAIVVEIRPEDVPESFRDGGHPALASARFQAWLEREAFLRAGSNGQTAPAQRLVDFLARRASKSLPESSYTAGLFPSRLDEWLPSHIETRLREAMPEFDRSMRGLVSEDALLIAPETRTSSPVRILRNPETLECEGLPGLFPAGEGSGYAGGISSSAMDGERAASAVVRSRLWA